MTNGQTRSQIQPGMKVRVVEKQNQRTGQLTEGVVQRILTNSPAHPHGIKVMLDNGIVGRVKEIVGRSGRAVVLFAGIFTVRKSHLTVFLASLDIARGIVHSDFPRRGFLFLRAMFGSFLISFCSAPHGFIRLAIVTARVFPRKRDAK